MRALWYITVLAFVLGVTIPLSLDMDAESAKYSVFEQEKIFHNDNLSRGSKEQLCIILRNNLTLIVSCSFLGALSFGVLSLVVVSFNGFIFGYIIRVCWYYNSTYLIFTKILPHSIEEIGIILSGVIGCFYGQLLFYKLSDHAIGLQRHQRHQSHVNYVLIPTCFFIIVVAAFLEVYVSIK